ncbi:MAG: hypothetical protein MASP_01380 [Candidatus Methanolliviera sp. GoM_asphalt]|nr:MAG: hypothetical protein MASP_01380 [Candidatus Methanolliviera sp. GoM_asphalt]
MDSNRSRTIGILVGPPISNILSMSSGESFESFSAVRIGDSNRFNVCSASCSNFARVNVTSKCFGSPPETIINGRFIVVDTEEESSIFAFSASSRIRCIAVRSPLKSIPSFSLNPATSQSITAASMSVPPRCVSPLVESTSYTPSPTSITVTSKVPPPKSRTATLYSPSLPSPYAIAAAVGSFIILSTLNPAISPASFVACRWLSSKYAGAVITAASTFSPKYASASVFIFCNTIEAISCGVNSLSTVFTYIFSELPIFLFVSRTVPSGLTTACRFAATPTNLWPSFVNATTDGNIFPPYALPSALGIIFASPLSSTNAASEFVVPRSMPIIRPIFICPYVSYHILSIQFQ